MKIFQFIVDLSRYYDIDILIFDILHSEVNEEHLFIERLFGFLN